MIYGYAQLLQFARNAGFKSPSDRAIAAIAIAESGGNDMAVNSADPNGGSFGLTQINGIHPGAAKTIGNPAVAFAMAYAVSKEGTNFTPWSTYTDGAYLKFMEPTKEIAMPSSTPLQTTGVASFTALTLEPTVAWILAGCHGTPPQSTALFISAALLVLGHGVYRRFLSASAPKT